MFSYTLRRLMRSTIGDGLTEDVSEFEATDDQCAIMIAQIQTESAEPESGMFVVELRDAGERIVWRLTRGDTVSRPPDKV